MNAILLLVTIAIVGLFIGLGVYIGRKLGGKNVSKAAREQGSKNLLFTMVLVFAMAGIIMLIAIWGFGQSIRNAFSISFTIIIIASFIYFIFFWLANRRRAGAVLLDIMPYPTKRLSLVSAGLFIFIGFLGAFSFFWKDTKYAQLASSLFGLSVGITHIITALSRLQVRENGILAYVDLIRWAKIESIAWTDEDKPVNSLKLRYKSHLPGALRNGVIPVPTEKRAELEAILEKCIPRPPLSDAGNYPQ
jgi:hypothetical protein